MTPDRALNAKRLSLGLLATVAVLLGGASTALAGVSVTAVPDVPTNVTAGTTVASSMSIRNTSFNAGGESNFDTDSFQVDDITLVPSCGSQVVAADCAGGARDPGVLVPGNTAAGQTGTACAGLNFTISLIDAAQGKYRFTPGASLILGPSGGSLTASRCIINYFTNVNRVPAIDSATGTPGLQTDQKGFASVEDVSVGSPNFGLTANGLGTTQTSVSRAATSISTAATPPPSPGSGGPVADTANLSGAASPTGTITFTLYGPGDATCAGTPVFTDTKPVTGNSAISAGFTPTQSGTYRWIAAYSGDANNQPVSGSCNDTGESVTVTLTRTLSVDAPHGTGVGYIDSFPAGIDCGNVAGHSDCTETVLDGTQITLTAHPNANSGFGGFTGGGCSTSPCTVTMDANKVIYPAMFLKPFPLDLTTAGSGSGYVDSSPAGIDCGRNLDGHADCAESYDPYVPEAVTLTAHPADDSDFAGFTGACADSGPTCTITMDDAKLATANFALKPGPDPPAATTPTTEITRMPSNPRPKRSHFNFVSSEPDSTFTCQLDELAPEPCASPAIYRDLKHGRHSFSVFATDALGNADATPVTTGFRVRHSRNR
jgi:hypothetical protein